MPTEEELAQMQAEEQAALDALDTQEDPSAPPGVPAFDLEAERARIREQVEAEVRAEVKPPAHPTASEEVPDRWQDPEAYDAYRDKKLTEQITGQIMGQFAPLLTRLNTDVVTNELSEGMVGAGREYIREIAGGIPVDQIQKNPKLRDLIRNAAENVEFKAARSKTVVPDRATTPMTISNVPRGEYALYTQYLDQSDVDAILKETQGR